MPRKSRESPVKIKSQASPSKSSSPEEPQRIRRPPNAFFLYRSHLWDTVKTQWAENSEKRQVNFSKYAGEQWQCESAEVRDHWEARAATEKKAHKERYPDYKFSPRPRGEPKPKRGRASGKKSAKAGTSRATHGDGQGLGAQGQLEQPLQPPTVEEEIVSEDVDMLSDDDYADHLHESDTFDFACSDSAPPTPAPPAAQFDWTMLRQHMPDDRDGCDDEQPSEASEELLKMEEDYIDYDGAICR